MRKQAEKLAENQPPPVSYRHAYVSACLRAFLPKEIGEDNNPWTCVNGWRNINVEIPNKSQFEALIQATGETAEQFGKWNCAVLKEAAKRYLEGKLPERNFQVVRVWVILVEGKRMSNRPKVKKPKMTQAEQEKLFKELDKNEDFKGMLEKMTEMINERLDTCLPGAHFERGEEIGTFFIITPNQKLPVDSLNVLGMMMDYVTSVGEQALIQLVEGQ